MSHTCVILLFFMTIVSCTLSSYLDIPPPPSRPMRFKTKEQIENYLKAVKDYYDAFKIKLVRRENHRFDIDQHSIESNSGELDDDDFYNRLYYLHRTKPSISMLNRAHPERHS